MSDFVRNISRLKHVCCKFMPSFVVPRFDVKVAYIIIHALVIKCINKNRKRLVYCHYTLLIPIHYLETIDQFALINHVANGKYVL